MDTNTLLWIIAAFVALAAFSMLGQALAMFGIYKRVKSIQDQVSPLVPRAEAVLANAKETLEVTRKQVQEVSTRTTQILDTTKTQMARFDEAMTDVAARAKVQMDKAELVIDDTMNRVHETVTLVHSGVVKPIKEINGLV
ncbi:MAG: hypothetical protein K2Q23_04750, partial [Bryobacteraceae bacterium]|nr:hypothetical protein [Bryobacteraceae bacterium]